MCELFAMSSRVPTTVNLSLREFAEHGGGAAAHKDGWGIAYYEDNDVRLLKDTTCANHSPWVQFVKEQELRGSLVMSHIRKATDGAIALKNTQPFHRELGGRAHVFTHNGHVPKIRARDEFRVGPFVPIGDTDSELAFCALLERLAPLWRNGASLPDRSARLEVVSTFAAELGEIGLANFIYSDGDTLFAHGDRRKHPDGAFRAPGLHVLRRRCCEPFDSTSGLSVKVANQTVVLIASVPLSNERWQPLEEGDVVAVANGSIES
jgi:glutamine amidotransferase